MAGKVSPLRTAPLTKPRAAVLVVEDDPDVAMSINDIVEERGYRAICVGNGREALSVLEKERPALMLVDLFMPIMNGAEFLKVVKQTPRLAGIPRVIMTAAERPDDQRQGRRHRALQAGRLRRARAPPAEVLRAVDATFMTLPVSRTRGSRPRSSAWRFWPRPGCGGAGATTRSGHPIRSSCTRRCGTRRARWSAVEPGWSVVEPVAPDDPRAAPLYKQFAVGFAAEVLRTDYLAKQLVRDAQWAGPAYPEASARRRASRRCS